MKVKCVICDQIESLDDDSPIAKKLRNRPIHTYMCQQCYDRIKEKTEARISTGKFKLYSTNVPEDEWW
ncbi:YlaI family protein [Caldibacillus lycopersici]|uniref:YlaI family protein n=1 Tax=Perspicuibacillus lycopersici TaxID=1325689 RepID=A0AAE3IRA5_9BACI|nr:YlaI family protein [Perspicuibacillus lycopersici]MCU9612243.1 YlaI family protein [Perspicuibacillus lycopersici]